MSLITPDIGLLFWMVVIFGAVFFILAKWGFPVITRMVEKRSDYIRDSLAAAEKARLELDSFASEQQKILDRTRAEQGKILAEASRTREEILNRAKEEAAAESAKILQKTREEITAEKEAALSELRSSPRCPSPWRRRFSARNFSPTPSSLPSWTASQTRPRTHR